MADFYDEDGEPLMDPDARDLSPEPAPQMQPYDDLDDDLDDDDGWNRDRSPTPVHGDGSSARPRKRLLKKGGGKGDSAGGAPAADALEDWGADEGADPDAVRKRPKVSSSLRDLAKGGGRARRGTRRGGGRRTGAAWSGRSGARGHRPAGRAVVVGAGARMMMKGKGRSGSSGIPSPGKGAQRMIKKVLELWMMIISSMILELTQLTVMTMIMTATLLDIMHRCSVDGNCYFYSGEAVEKTV